MHDDFILARELAERNRFSEDIISDESIDYKGSADQIKSHLSQSDLQVSSAVTPHLSKSLEKVIKRLQMPSDSVEAFVYSMPGIQAESYCGSSSQCVIRFSSGLIDILNAEEIEFVAGHEIGHFLLNHGMFSSDVRAHSLEHFMHFRSQEISADRIGLLACQSINVALKSLMKLVSGLGDKHLRFDITKFISQLKNVSEIHSFVDQTPTHPSILVRSRALLWFSLTDYYLQGAENYSANKMKKLDERVIKDLTKFIDGPTKKLIEEAKNSHALWLTISDMVDDGVFDANEQKILNESFGEDNLKGFLNLIEGRSKKEVIEISSQKLKESREELAQLIPMSFKNEEMIIKKKVLGLLEMN